MAPPRSSASARSSKSSSRSARTSSPTVLKITVLTLFPEALRAPLRSSLVGKALKSRLLKVKLVQIRDYSEGKHRIVDDTPYGGGAGMVLRADVLHRAWKAAGGEREGVRTVLLSPQGPLWNQIAAKRWMAAGPQELILVCGHYEGVDERFIDLCVDEEVSIGDYILTGGELPALVLIDTLARLVPGVIGNSQSVSADSLEGGLLKYPQFTRPREFEGMPVPDVLLSGDHGKIEAWRRDQSQERTRRKRPDLG